MPAGICISRLVDGYFFDANDRFLELTGFTSEELLGHTALELNCWHDWQDRESLISRLRKDGTVHDFHTRLRLKSGDVIDAIVNAEKIDFSGECCILAITQDVTSQKRAEARLRESEERFRQLVEASALLVWTTDANGIPQEESPTWQAFTGQSVKRWFESIHPDDQEQVAAALHKAVETRTPFESESRVRHHTGGYRWFACRSAPVIHHDGRVKLWVGMSMDITSRKTAEEALHRYELLAGHSRDIILFMRRQDGRLLEANQAATLAYGYDRDEILALTIHDLRAAETHELTKAQLTEADERGILFESRHRRKDGSVFPVEVSSRGATIGETRTLISVIRDISERKKHEDDLLHAQIQLAHMARFLTVGEMVASIAHEVNKPIYTIANYAKACGTVLAKDAPNLDDLRDWCREIAVAASRTGAIITRLLKFTQRTESAHEPAELHAILNEAVALVESEVRTTFAEIHRQFSDAESMVEGDRIQIQQVVVNLLQNACQALAMQPLKGRQLTVSTVAAENCMQVTVADNGPGIADGAHAKLFTPFFTTKSDGIGMGLAISKSIVEAHGGRIWATSNNGEGAAFHFTIPKARIT
jgi:PAS domain S-box-containing protein